MTKSKVKIIRQVLLEKQSISAVCEEHKLQPSLYYLWQKQFFENGTASFGFLQNRDDLIYFPVLRFHGLSMATIMPKLDSFAGSGQTVYRVLSMKGLLGKKKSGAGRKNTGFEQPVKPHEHWHVDISYLNISGTFYYLCSVLDGCSRYIVHWELRESMTEAEVERVMERAREAFTGVKPRVISDHGPQFISWDFKEYIRVTGMSHVRTSPYYPQSNGKIERWHKSLKKEAIRPMTPLSLEDAIAVVTRFVNHYNDFRLHSALGYVTPKDKLEGRQQALWAERDRKLEAARELRRQARARLKRVSTPAEAHPEAAGQLC